MIGMIFPAIKLVPRARSLDGNIIPIIPANAIRYYELRLNSSRNKALAQTAKIWSIHLHYR